ncbi:glycerophosphodiester phosphodiesterase [Candidatus Woesebacteria bacterium]|nr:glycerophosphodiester phosphodiesterase [Candidatus Woesebacteria bacterium]|tara:strand:- start:63 stop:740 length:678 start_codon:yes stop_codon:yes gene_type:complete
MQIIGHRGASGHAPENTLASFQKALDFKVDMVELDVRLCKTGELVLMHDKDVERTTNGHGEVSDLTLAELKKLDSGEGQKIPTLIEVIDLVNRQVPIIIELKGEGTARPAVQTIHRYVKESGYSNSDFIVSSFRHNELATVRRLDPNINVATLWWNLPIDVNKLDPMIIDARLSILTSEIVKEAQAAGRRVHAFVGNEMSEIKEAKSLGVDAIHTDYPDRAQKIL